jgi:hypothetical protein
MPESIDVAVEPAGAVYLALLALAERRGSQFSLAWRRQLSFDENAARIEAALRPFLVSTIETSEWPGTTLIGHSGIVRTYRLAPQSTRVLAAAERLFAWLAPARPEDLAFYTADGRCWLGSIAHERDAFVRLEANDLNALGAAVPGLELKRPPERRRTE